MRTPQIAVTVILASLLIGKFGASQAQTSTAGGPSLAETLDYINSRVIAGGGHLRNIRVHLGELGADHTIIVDGTSLYQDNKWWDFSRLIPAMKNLGVSKTSDYYVRISGPEQGSCITAVDMDSGTFTSKTNVAYIGPFSPDSEQMDRLVKAVKHLIELEVPPENPNDPFK